MTQEDIQEITHPVIEAAYKMMADQGIAPHEAAQAMLFAATGVLARSLGPQGAGFALRDLAEKQTQWLCDLANAAEAQEILN